MNIYDYPSITEISIFRIPIFCPYSFIFYQELLSINSSFQQHYSIGLYLTRFQLKSPLYSDINHSSKYSFITVANRFYFSACLLTLYWIIQGL